MLNNQLINLDLEIAQFKKTLLDKYGVDVYIYEKLRSSGYMRPTVSQIEKACVQVMHEMYPDYINYTNLSVLLRKREIVMFRKIYCYLGYHAKYTCDHVGKHVNRDHSSVIHGKNSVEDMLHIKDKDYVKAMQKVTKIIQKYVGTTPKNHSGTLNTQSVPTSI